MGQVGGSTNIELEEEIESLTALSFKLGERREVKTQKTNEMQKVLETLGTWKTHTALGNRKTVTTALHSRLTASKIDREHQGCSFPKS